MALKVATELFDESQALAELQHVHNSYIMPLYSWHETGSLQAVCMPYLGGTTLAHVLKALKGKALPTSGRHLVSTLHDRKSSTILPSALRARGSGGDLVSGPESRAPNAERQLRLET